MPSKLLRYTVLLGLTLAVGAVFYSVGAVFANHFEFLTMDKKFQAPKESGYENYIMLNWAIEDRAEWVGATGKNGYTGLFTWKDDAWGEVHHQSGVSSIPLSSRICQNWDYGLAEWYGQRTVTPPL